VGGRVRPGGECVRVALGVLGVMNARTVVVLGPTASYELMLMGVVLLVLAAMLLGMKRKTRITLDNSLMTEELMVYLERITNALERAQKVDTDEITVNVLKRIDELAKAKPSPKVREMPVAVTARQYRQE